MHDSLCTLLHTHTHTNTHTHTHISMNKFFFKVLLQNSESAPYVTSLLSGVKPKTNHSTLTPLWLPHVCFMHSFGGGIYSPPLSFLFTVLIIISHLLCMIAHLLSFCSSLTITIFFLWSHTVSCFCWWDESKKEFFCAHYLFTSSMTYTLLTICKPGARSLRWKLDNHALCNFFVD